MFGFGKGKVELALNSTNPAFGEIITGTASMQLKSQQQARGFIVQLLAERSVTRSEYRNGKHYNDTHTETVYQSEQQLGGEGPYGTQPYQFQFQMKLPQQSEIPGASGGFWNALSGVGKPNWYVVAKLDIPNGMDVSKKLKISVH